MCLFERMPLYSLSLNSAMALTEFSVARKSFSPWSLVPSKIQCPLIVSSLFSDLTSVLNSLLGVVGSLPPPMVQDPGLNPFMDILPRSAPKLGRGYRPPKGHPRSRPPDISLVPAPTPLLEVASAPENFANSFFYTITSL